MMRRAEILNTVGSLEQMGLLKSWADRSQGQRVCEDAFAEGILACSLQDILISWAFKVSQSVRTFCSWTSLSLILKNYCRYKARIFWERNKSCSLLKGKSMCFRGKKGLQEQLHLQLAEHKDALSHGSSELFTCLADPNNDVLAWTGCLIQERWVGKHLLLVVQVLLLLYWIQENS